jgi:hypothetical protein
MLLPKLRLTPSELRGRLELVGFMGDNIEGINELPELAPVYRYRSCIRRRFDGSHRYRKADSQGTH